MMFFSDIDEPESMLDREYQNKASSQMSAESSVGQNADKTVRKINGHLPVVELIIFAWSPVAALDTLPALFDISSVVVKFVAELLRGIPSVEFW